MLIYMYVCISYVRRYMLHTYVRTYMNQIHIMLARYATLHESITVYVAMTKHLRGKTITVFAILLNHECFTLNSLLD